MQKLTVSLASILILVSMAASAQAAPAQTAPPKPWSYALAFSYLGPTGNTDTQTFGADFTF